jgi:hypothetical protein
MIIGVLPSGASAVLQFFGQKRLDSVKNDIFSFGFSFEQHFSFVFLRLLCDKKMGEFLSRATKETKAEEKIILICLVLFSSFSFTIQFVCLFLPCFVNLLAS